MSTTARRERQLGDADTYSPGKAGPSLRAQAATSAGHADGISLLERVLNRWRTTFTDSGSDP